jgi:hypothetical protein
MTRHYRQRAATIALAIAPFSTAPILAQTNVDPAHPSAWQENCGWTNWHDAAGGGPVGALGAHVGATFLSGWIWGENIGWISLGSGAPGNGIAYANPTGGMVAGVPEFGVNRDATTGHLSGFAWGENVGWINFSGGALAAPAQPARVDAAAYRLRGYAWGENIGWLNLDDATRFVGIGPCPADVNASGGVDADDLFVFLDAWFAGSITSANFNGDCCVDSDDLFAYLDAWFAQNGVCP